MYKHTVGLLRNTWYRVDTASGSSTPTTVTAPDGVTTIGNRYGGSGSTVRNITPEDQAVFTSATQVLYLKPLDWLGNVDGSGVVVTSTGVDLTLPAGPPTPGDYPSTYVPFTLRRNVWAIGDSVTDQNVGWDVNLYGASVATGRAQGGMWFGNNAWTTWALLASGAKWTVSGIFATAGYTSAQILSTHVPQVIAAATKGDVVVVHAGTNGQSIADTQSIHTTLRAAGLRTVCVLVPPKISLVDGIASFNAQLARWAQGMGIPIADGYGALVDPATGLYLAANDSGDGVHPNGVGAKLLGEAIATAVNTLFPDAQPLVQQNATTTGYLKTKPLALGTPTLGTDYVVLSSLGTSTWAPGAWASVAGGNAYLFSRGDTDGNITLGNVTLTAGHKYRVGMAVDATAPNGSWRMYLDDAATGLKFPWGLGFHNSQTSYYLTSTKTGPARFYSEFTLPAGATTEAYRWRVRGLGASAAIKCGEVTVWDLTVLGLT